MNAKTIFMVIVLATLGIIALAFAQPSEEPAKATEEQKEELARVEQLRQKFLEERAEILSQIFEKRAQLARLSGQKDRDEKEVQKLLGEIAELRAALWKKCAEYRPSVGPAGTPFAPWCGMGAYGLGPSYPHAPGRGYGLGPGAGLGYPPVGRGGPRHFAPGYGWGIPRGGPGAGFGPGRGAGFGLGRGLGLGPGRGMGAYGMRTWGPGPFFTDEDNDGVCDYWEGAVPPAAIPHRPEGRPPVPPVHEAPKPPETK